MPKDQHNTAAEHHENAAKSHRIAAEHHGKGEHAKGKEHSAKAQQYSQTAVHHTEQAHSKSQATELNEQIPCCQMDAVRVTLPVPPICGRCGELIRPAAQGLLRPRWEPNGLRAFPCQSEICLNQVDSPRGLGSPGRPYLGDGHNRPLSQ